MAAISYTLLIDGAPAQPELLAAMQQLEVEDHAEMADMMRLRIAIGVKDGCSGWTVLDEELFPRLARLRVDVTVGSGRSETLMNAYVVETNATFGNEPGQSILNVVAMDPTSIMNLREKVKPWPNMSDSDIAQAIFTDPKYGFDPVVDETKWRRQENDQTMIQRGTDIRFLQQLAERNGFECYVETNGQTGRIEGHFHAPRLNQTPQGVLSVNMGEATNVNSFSARYDMLRPTTAVATNLDIASREKQAASAQDLERPALGSQPALGEDQQRVVLPARTGLVRAGERQPYAQAVADRSAFAITAEGEVNTAAYGAVLRAKRPIQVRGAGRQFSGTYYVDRVLHTFTGDSYRQTFSLRRNALGLKGTESFVEDNALAS